MIREDYILRMIRQFAQVLARILDLTKAQEYPAALEAIDQVSEQLLLGLDFDAVGRFSPGELMSVLLIGQDLNAGRDKCAFLVALLQQTGIVHAAQNRPDESHAAYLKALTELLTHQRSRT